MSPRDPSHARENPAQEPPRRSPETTAETIFPSPETTGEPVPAPPRRLGERPPNAPSKEARVKIIIDLMVESRWQTGITGGELAAEWGLHPGTVDHDAAEASRYVRRLVDPDVVRTRLSVVLGQALEHGLRMIEGGVGEEGETIRGDARALSGLASVAKTYALLAGAGAETKPPAPGAERPSVTVRYADGVEPLPALDGDPLQPAAEPGPPAPSAGQ